MTDDMATRPAEADAEIEINVDIDPVCGALVDPEEADLRSLCLEYEGRQYVFCGEGCRALFEEAPIRFAAAGRAEP